MTIFFKKGLEVDRASSVSPDLMGNIAGLHTEQVFVPFDS